MLSYITKFRSKFYKNAMLLQLTSIVNRILFSGLLLTVFDDKPCNQVSAGIFDLNFT